MDAWNNSGTYTFAEHLEPETGETIATLLLREEPPWEAWALVLGECLFNFRSALDNLAFELAAKRHGAPLPAAAAKTSAFPIFGSQPPSPQQIQDRIGLADPAAQTVIQALQPHHRGTPGFESDPLYILDKLCNLDKHRALHLVLPVIEKVETVKEVGGTVSDITIAPGPIRHGAEVFRYRRTPNPPNTQMQVELKVTGWISFDESLPIAAGKPVIPILKAINYRIVNDVFGPLAQFLQ
jgi:hypothetical protein